VILELSFASLALKKTNRKVITLNNPYCNDYAEQQNNTVQEVSLSATVSGTDATQAYARIHDQSTVENAGTSYIIGKLGSKSGIQEVPC
jgi:hypothetical protein